MDFAEQELNFMLLLNGTIMARNSNARVVNGRTIYKRTQLDTWSDFECKHFLRFTYPQIERICEAIGLEPILSFGSVKVKREFALGLLLYRLAFPCRLFDMVSKFGMSKSNIGTVISRISDLLYKKFKWGLQFDERQFSRENCERFSKAIADKGAYYEHIVGFIDGTMQQICRPKDSEQQRVFYNGWKHIHCLKYQAINTPDGITSSLFGPYGGSSNDRGMLNESQLMRRLSAHFETASPDKWFAIYGDEAYWFSKHIIPPNRKPFTSDHEKKTNESMSKVRVSIEMEFGKVSQYFAGCKWKYGNRLNQTKPALKYTLSTVFKNFHTCLNGSTATKMFALSPPTLEEYISGLMRERSENDIDE